jgi:protein-S-isoprenylcysteine O-methyltransferase Ste14
VYQALGFTYAGSEERTCLEKYGDAYLEYVKKTPRYLGIPKS